MKFTISKEQLTEHLTLANRFTSHKLTAVSALQGILLTAKDKELHIYATNLNAFFHGKLKIAETGTFKVVIDPKKLTEFLSLLEAGKVTIEVKEAEVVVTQDKTKGVFAVMESADFPLPPVVEDSVQKIKTKVLTDNLSQVLFSTSSDDARPVLTAVNITTVDEELIIVTTDGFRLSLLKMKREINIPAVLVSRDFLSEVLRYIKEEDMASLSYSDKEKLVKIAAGECEFYSRLIEGEFPPYERVIPTDKKTSVTVDREEFLRAVKIISVFARDFSNIVIAEFGKDGVHLRPKTEKSESDAFVETESFEGDSQKVAFNFRFLIDFLTNVKGKKVTVEVLRPDAPVAFRSGDKNFLHIIMPVRIQAE